MVNASSKAGHARPAFLERKEKGVFAVKGTQIVVRADGKVWKVEGVKELGKETFATRHAATERIEQLGLVPEVLPEQPEPAKDEAKPDPTPAKATTARKPRAKAAAKS